MNCEAVRELLWAYLEKETTAEEAEKIEEHLENCEDCRKELEFQQEMMETLAGLPDEELPEGYHAELMQKLQAEAAPNVVPFPVKKKKQPVYKQWGMIAAAVLVVVAAGGMNGMLGMRESQNAAVAEMKAVDTAETADYAMDDLAVAEEAGSAEVKPKTEADYGYQKMNEPAAGLEVAATTTQDGSIAAYDMDAAVEVVSEEDMMKFSIARSAKVEAHDKADLLVHDTTTALTELQKAIAEAGGYEEPAEEGSIFAVIPAENYAGFVKAVENIGELAWTQKGKIETEGTYQTIEIILKNS